MEKKKILKCALSALLLLSLAACGNGGNANGGNSGGGSGGDSGGDSGGGSGGGKTAADYLQDALAADYTNCTVNTATKYKESEDDLDSDAVEYDSCVYYYKSYAILYSEAMAEAEYENPYLYYHDYNGENLLYFEADYEGGPDAWLKEYENGTSYALKYTNFYLPAFLTGINPEYCSFYAGMYYITDEAEIARLNQEVFCGIWENDIQDVCIVLNDDATAISRIYGFEDLDNDTEYTVIAVTDIGTTVFDDSLLPEAPNENNVMEYWQYKGWKGPTVNVYPNAIRIDVTDDVASDPLVLEIDRLAHVESTLAWPEMDPERHNVQHDHVTWHSTDETIAECSYEKVDGEWVRTIVAVGEGECEIYAVAEGVNEEVSYDTYDQGVESNHLTVRVNGLAALDKTGAKNDIYFSSISDDVLTYNDWVSGSAVEGKAATSNASLLNTNELFYEGDDALYALLLNPNNMDAASSVTFTLDASVTKISFYYGLYYESQVSNISSLSAFTVSSSVDGETWNDVDMTEEVKDNLSAEHLKLLTVNVTEGTMIRISVKASMIGRSLSIATSNIVMY